MVRGDCFGVDRGRLRALRAQEEAHFAERTPRSRQLLEAARLRMPRGVPMGWMAGLYRHPPIFAAHGHGARFVDADGNRYLDMNQADLSMTCGFNPPEVVEAVARRMEAGSHFLLPTQDAIAVAGALADRFGLPYWQFTLSASSANVEALRVARVATGRKQIVIFHGKYHGHIDDTLASDDGSGPVHDLLGLPSDAGRHTTAVEFNDLAALERALAAGQVAAVLTEPALTNCTLVLPDAGFHVGVRRLTRAYGALLILDETHTQAAAFGGLTRAWGLEPDIVTLGKSLGGGVPIGAYGMTGDLAQTMERHPEIDIGDQPGLATGGTMYANALSLAAARAALDHVLTPEGYARVGRLGAWLADGLEAIFARRGLPWRAHRLGGRSGYCLTPALPHNAREAAPSIDAELIDTPRVFLANRGIWEAIATSGPAVSFAHVEADIDEYLAAADAFCATLAG